MTPFPDCEALHECFTILDGIEECSIHTHNGDISPSEKFRSLSAVLRVVYRESSFGESAAISIAKETLEVVGGSAADEEHARLAFFPSSLVWRAAELGSSCLGLWPLPYPWVLLLCPGGRR